MWLPEERRAVYWVLNWEQCWIVQSLEEFLALFWGGVIGGAYSSWLASPNTRAIPSFNVPGCSFMANECMILVKEDLSVNTAAVIVKDDKILERLNVDEELLERVNLDEECLTVGSIHNILLSSLDGSVVVDSNVKNESLNLL